MSDSQINERPLGYSNVVGHDPNPSLSDQSDHSSRSQHSSSLATRNTQRDSELIKVEDSRSSHTFNEATLDLLTSIVSDLKDSLLSDLQGKSGSGAVSPLFCDIPGAQQISFLAREASSPCCTVCQLKPQQHGNKHPVIVRFSLPNERWLHTQ